MLLPVIGCITLRLRFPIQLKVGPFVRKVCFNLLVASFQLNGARSCNKPPRSPVDLVTWFCLFDVCTVSVKQLKRLLDMLNPHQDETLSKLSNFTFPKTLENRNFQVFGWRLNFWIEWPPPATTTFLLYLKITLKSPLFDEHNIFCKIFFSFAIFDLLKTFLSCAFI